MTQNRPEQRQNQFASSIPVMTEVLRSAGEGSKSSKEEKEDNKLPLFWRVFGSTMLSITALVVMTSYQSLSSSMTEIRSEMSSLLNDINKEVTRLAEMQGELVSKEEVASRSQMICRNLKELKEEKQELLDLKKSCATVTELQRTGNAERRKLADELQRLRERRIQQQERRALAAEVASMRERLAGLEGKHEVSEPRMK